MKTTTRLASLAILPFMLVVSSGASAQGQMDRMVPGIREVPVEPDFPDPLDKPPPSDMQVLPPAQLDEQGVTTGKPVLTLKGVQVDGNTVLSVDELNTLAQPYLNRAVSIEELQQLRLELSKLYFAKGYVNSGAVLPEQEVTEGIVKYQIIEGNLTDVEIVNNTRWREQRIAKQVGRQVDEPLNIIELQQSIQMLEQNPLVRSVNAQLVPGSTLGTSILKMNVHEAKPYRLYLGANNYRPPSVGSEQGVVTFVHRNVTGNADELTLSGSFTEGLSSGYFNYALPLNAADTQLAFSYTYSDSAVVEEPLNVLDVEGEAQYASVMISHPFINRLDRRFAMSLAFNNNSSKSSYTFGDFPTLGSIDGESETANIRLGAEWTERWANQVLALRGALRRGLNTLDATIHDSSLDLPDGEYTAFVGQLQFISRFQRYVPGELHFRNAFQWANDPLLAIEKFAVGGRYTVRGYRQNQYVRDNAFVANLEYQIPLIADDFGRSRYGLRLIPFFDVGYARDDKLETEGGLVYQSDDAKTIKSLGLGLTWDPALWFHFEFFWGHQLDDVPEPEEDNLQDDGIVLGLTFSWPFNP